MSKKTFRSTRFVSVLAIVLLVIAAQAMLSAPARAANGNAVVHPDPLSVGLRSGQEQDVSIRVDSAKDLYGIEFQIKFDPKVVQVKDADDSKEGVQIATGDWFADGFVAVNQVDNAKGTISYAATLLNPAPPVSGDGTVATISFRAKGDGTSPLKISKALLATREAAEIKSQVQDGAIGVSALGQAPSVKTTNTGSNPTQNAGNKDTSALPGAPSMLLLAAAGAGVLAFVVAVVAVMGIVLFRRKR